MKTKICTKCKTEKSESEFYYDGFYLRSDCKECKKADINLKNNLGKSCKLIFKKPNLKQELISFYNARIYNYFYGKSKLNMV